MTTTGSSILGFWRRTIAEIPTMTSAALGASSGHRARANTTLDTAKSKHVRNYDEFTNCKEK